MEWVAWAAAAIVLEAGLARACEEVGTVERAMHRTLIVANRTASTPVLMQEVERRAMEQATSFVLLIPYTQWKRSPDWTLEDALKALRRAARGPSGLLEARVEGRVGGEDPFESVKQILELERLRRRDHLHAAEEDAPSGSSAISPTGSRRSGCR